MVGFGLAVGILLVLTVAFVVWVRRAASKGGAASCRLAPKDAVPLDRLGVTACYSSFAAWQVADRH